MEKEKYKERIEQLGYKATDKLVEAVEKAHSEKLTDALIDHAYANFRREQNKPVALNGEPEAARRGRPANKLAKATTGQPGGGAPAK
jgi:hypothetical protein